MTVELNGTLANATGLATGDDVEKGGLARAGRAHEREEALGARRRRHGLEQLLGPTPSLLRDVHSVLEISPRDGHGNELDVLLVDVNVLCGE